MNLSTVSEQLNMSIQDLRVKAREAGFSIHPRANKIDNVLAKNIITALAPKPTTVIQETVAPAQVVIQLPAFIKVRDFAETLKRPVTEVIKLLIQNGVMATINEEIDYETAAIIAQDLGAQVAEAQTEDKYSFGPGFLQSVISSETDDLMQPRPPIVAVMGHVDHGKTTLLDAIRSSRVALGESGGITQHIGAYQVQVEKQQPEKPAKAKKTSKKSEDSVEPVTSKQKITFLDTPGHEAFSEMRARGANVTDIIVLVVAADDGVRPQTVEVINRAKFTNTPIIVAINKVDKENANPLRVKQELAEYGILTEDWGGKTIAVEISAKKKMGIDTLLEMILLTAELENFKANPTGQTVGTVIESHTELGKGPVASVIIQNGTLRVGDTIVAGVGYGRVKSMEDEVGVKLKIAPPSTPVQISGLSATPEAGDVLQQVDSIEAAKTIADTFVKQARSHRLRSRHTLEGDASSKSLNLIIKADVAGSLGAIKESLGKLKNNEVKLNILAEGIGEINESDILMAAPSKASVIGFRVKPNPKAVLLAKQKKVTIDQYEVIYELLENITSAVVKLFTPEYEKVSFGMGKVLAIFRTEKDSMIIGGQVNSGEIKKNKRIAIYRGEDQIGTGEIAELQQQKINTKEVSQGSEFGMKITTTTKIKEGDILESFEENLKQKSL